MFIPSFLANARPASASERQGLSPPSPRRRAPLSARWGGRVCSRSFSVMGPSYIFFVFLECSQYFLRILSLPYIFLLLLTPSSCLAAACCHLLSLPPLQAGTQTLLGRATNPARRPEIDGFSSCHSEVARARAPRTAPRTAHRRRAARRLKMDRFPSATVG